MLLSLGLTQSSNDSVVVLITTYILTGLRRGHCAAPGRCTLGWDVPEGLGQRYREASGVPHAGPGDGADAWQASAPLRPRIGGGAAATVGAENFRS